MVKEIDADKVKKSLDVIKESYDFIDKLYSKLNIGSPLASTITYLYPKSKMRTTSIYKLPDRQRWLQRTKIRLPMGNNFKIANILDLDTGTSYTDFAINYENQQAVLDPTKLPDGSERFMIVTENDLGIDFLKALVDVRASEVSSKEDEGLDKHWIVAAVRDDTLWNTWYKQATFEDVDINVGVSVDRYYSTVLRTVENPLMRLMKANEDIFKGIDTNNRSLENVGKDARRRIRQRELKDKKGDLFQELARLCLPNIFKNYMSIDNPNFSLVDARRSENLLTLGNIIIPIPSGVNVILYTTLDIKDSTQKGNLIFDRKLFSNNIEKILRSHFKLGR